jgi:S1-C subfamily serine protease
MLQAHDEVYTPYTQPSSGSSSVGVLDDYALGQIPLEQDVHQPPRYPAEPPVAPPAPRKRPGRFVAIVLLILALVLIFGVGLFAGWEFTTNKSTPSTASTTTSSTTTSSATTQTQQEAAIARIEPSVVEIKVITSQGEAIGSGVIIDSNGDIVTNNHVVSGAQSITIVLNTGNTEQGQIVGTSAANDLAVVRIQPFAHMTVTQIGDSSKLTVGQEVMAVGNPLGITETATEGIVSALNRSVTESTGATISNAIQTSAALNPGNSGGALINLQGQLIGIPTLTAVDTETNTAANGVGFAIPSNLVKTVIQQIIQQ